MTKNKDVILRADAPMVWDGSDALQFGIDSVVLRVQRPNVAEQKLLLELKQGTSTEALLEYAKSISLTTEHLSAFLQKYSAVIDYRGQVCATDKRAVAVVGDHRTERFIAEILARCSWQVSVGGVRKRFGKQIIVSADRFYPNHLANGSRLFEGHFLIPVLFSDQSVLISPVITSELDYEILKPVFNRSEDETFKHLAFQVNSRPVATECASILTVVSGLILEQLYAFKKDPDPIGSAFKVERLGRSFSISTIDLFDEASPKHLERAI